MIGTILDKYEVLQKVGEGGMATVYRGRHSTLDRFVAIKVLHPHLSSSVRNRKRFEREAQAIEHLRHENILEIYDYSGMEGSDCYIVTEFVEGETLSAVLHRRGKLPSEIVARIGLTLARALAYAHACGVLHRDIKTDNVMLRVDGTVKLMDFGIARFLDETKVTMTGALVGSPAFMSPEQAREGTLDQRSDLFALGTVLFYLATGHLPFTGSNPSLILKNVIEGNRPNVAELVPTMSAALVDAVERLMATDPQDRYVQAADVERAMLVVLDEAQTPLDAVEWTLQAWLQDPDGYEQRLDGHLKRVLVDEGRRLLGSGDHLAALRLFNRVLSMEEDNAEVLALVQSLHGEPHATASTRRTRWVAAGALAVLVLGFGALALVSRTGDRPPPGEPPHARSDAGPEPAGAALVQAPPPAPVPVVVPAPTPPRPQALAPRPLAAPAPLAARPPDAVADDGGLGSIWLNTGNAVADVYLRGKRLGNTRQEYQLPEGTHVLVLKSTLYFDAEVQVTVTGGERQTSEVKLRPIPSVVTFSPALGADCKVVANGHERGTVEDLARNLEVERPYEELSLVVRCPNGEEYRREWSTVPLEVRFP